MTNYVKNDYDTKTVSDYIKRRGGIDNILESQNTNLACIVSGTGSGKSYWVKHTLSKSGRILFVTSRSAKVLQDKDDIESNLSFVNEFNDITNVVCTNWALSQHIKELCSNVSKEEGMKNIDAFINGYDYIVFDEFHSLVCDSLFNNEIFNVAVFFCYCVVQMKKKTIILTATIQPVKFLIDSLSNVLKETPDTEGMAMLEPNDDECEYVVPEQIRVIDKNKTKNEKIDDLLKSGKKFIYFMNMVGDEPLEDNRKGCTIYQEYEYLINYGLKEEEIAVIVSRDAQKKWEQDHNCKENKESEKYKNSDGSPKKLTYNEWVREKIALKQEIPNGVRVLLCSATLNEGISIKNEVEKPFTHIITDAHYISTIIQQMGRLRKNLKEFWVINDARQHHNSYDEIELKFVTSKTKNDFKFLEYLTEYTENIKDYKEREKFINWLRKKGFKLIEYIYITHRFEFNNLKYNMINEVNRVEEQKKNGDFKNMRIWQSELKEFADEHGIIFKSSNNTRINDELKNISEIRKHITSVLDINFYGSEWKKEQALLKDLNLGSTEKTINKKLMSLGMEFQLNKRETYTHGRYVYSFSRYNINSSKW